MREHPLIREAGERMKKSVDKIEEELKHLRTGRASPAILENIKIDYYGTPTPINQLASITPSGDSRTLVIKPWDKTMLKTIEKAILASDLGLTPFNDGNIIRINFPTPTTEQREKWVKHAKEIVEEGKIAVRNIRRDIMKRIKDAQKDGEIPEDDARRLEDELQKKTDDTIKELDKLFEAKKEEIMEF